MVPRVPAIDRLRAVALVLMLMHHFTKWLAGDPRSILPGWEGFVVTDLAAPAFVITAGASAHLFAASRRLKGQRVMATVVRRYGLLIPIGIALQTLTSRHPWEWGVLQTIGAAVVVSIVARPPAIWAAAALVSGPMVEHAFAHRPGYVAEILGGNFPLVTYVGFALVGAMGARLLLRNPNRGAQALALGVALVAVAIALGEAPDRYPGDASFVIPGLAGTLLLYGLLDRGMPARVDSLLGPAGTHSLGIFMAHYAAFWAITRYGMRSTFSPAAAVLIAIVATTALSLIAPHVPTLPWSPRTGWRDQKRVASSAAYRATTASVSAVR